MASRTPKEFSRYTVGTEIKVRQMVDNDNITYVKPFYESLSSSDIPVNYIPNFWDALKETKNHNIIIISTKIDIVNQYTCNCINSVNKKISKQIPKDSLSSHAVSLIKDGGLYLFDPNGITYDDDTWLYLNKKKTKGHHSESFKKYIKRFKIDIILPDKRGIQFHCNAPDTGFIHGQGYCMFYNYIGIEKAIKFKKKNKRKKMTKFLKDINVEDTKHNFPSDSNLGNYTKSIIDKIF